MIYLKKKITLTIVAYHNFDDIRKAVESIEKYNSKDSHIKFYEINLDDAFNKNFVSNKSNIVEDIDNLKVSGDTLFKIKDKKIEFYKEGTSDISSYLKEISA